MERRIRNITLRSRISIPIIFFDENILASTVNNELLMLSVNDQSQVETSLIVPNQNMRAIGVLDSTKYQNLCRSMANAIKHLEKIGVHLWAKANANKGGICVGVPDKILLPNNRFTEPASSQITKLENDSDDLSDENLATSGLATNQINIEIKKIVSQIFPVISSYQARMIFHLESGEKFSDFASTLENSELAIESELRQLWNDLEKGFGNEGTLFEKVFRTEIIGGEISAFETIQFRGSDS